MFVGGGICGSTPLQSGVVVGEQRDAQCPHGRARDFLLDREDILETTVEGLGPQLHAVGADELCGDTHTVPGLAYAAVEDRAHLQHTGDFAVVEGTAPELERP